MEIHPEIRTRLPQIIELFKAHKVKNAYLFGSALTVNYSDRSDIDFLVNFHDNIDPVVKGELWWNLHDRLRETMNREIDLVTETSLKNPYLIKEIDSTKVRIYG
jgi:uncharacterized protein